MAVVVIPEDPGIGCVSVLFGLVALGAIISLAFFMFRVFVYCLPFILVAMVILSIIGFFVERKRRRGTPASEDTIDVSPVHDGWRW